MADVFAIELVSFQNENKKCLENMEVKLFKIVKTKENILINNVFQLEGQSNMLYTT